MTRPAITRDADSAPALDAARDGTLLIKKCSAGHWLGPDAHLCPAGLEHEVSWAPASGAARLVSWAVVHRKLEGGGTAPAAGVGLVALAEGPWLLAAVDLDGDIVPAVDLPLAVRFEPAGDEWIPVFEAAPAPHNS